MAATEAGKDLKKNLHYILLFLITLFCLDRFFFGFVIWRLPNESPWGTNHFFNFIYEKKRIERVPNLKPRILLSKGKLVDKWSFNIGTLRMTLGKVKEKHWKELDVWVDHFKGKYTPLLGIGSGGNINTIQKHFVKRKEQEVYFSDLQKTFDALNGMTLDERILKYGFRPDRADVIVPAAQIFMHIMKRLNIETLHVPKVGLGDGMIHEMYEKMTKGKKVKKK